MMLTEVIEDGAAVRFAGRGEEGLCTLGEAIAELLAGYGSIEPDWPIEENDESSVELELVACDGVPA